MGVCFTNVNRAVNHVLMESTSTSNSSMTPNTTPRLSINPLTATLSMRLVVALYSVLSTVSLLSALASLSSTVPLTEPPCGALVKDSVRCTRGESSASTSIAWRADEASRWDGNGRLITLRSVNYFANDRVRFARCLQGAWELVMDVGHGCHALPQFDPTAVTSMQGSVRGAYQNMLTCHLATGESDWWEQMTTTSVVRGVAQRQLGTKLRLSLA